MIYCIINSEKNILNPIRDSVNFEIKMERNKLSESSVKWLVILKDLR